MIGKGRYLVVSDEQLMAMHTRRRMTWPPPTGCSRNSVSGIYRRHGIARTYRQEHATLCPCRHGAECRQRVLSDRAVMCESDS